MMAEWSDKDLIMIAEHLFEIEEAILNQQREYSGGNDVPESLISSLPFGEWIEIGIEVKTKRIKSKFSAYLAYVKMGSKSLISEHHHSNLKEVIRVMDGEYSDLTTGARYRSDAVQVIKPGQVHEIYSEAGAVLLVEFYKPSLLWWVARFLRKARDILLFEK